MWTRGLGQRLLRMGSSAVTQPGSSRFWTGNPLDRRIAPSTRNQGLLRKVRIQLCDLEQIRSLSGPPVSCTPPPGPPHLPQTQWAPSPPKVLPWEGSQRITPSPQRPPCVQGTDSGAEALGFWKPAEWA